jgi:3-hydroxyisobutyrate dehydrogenase-like beta-hydroxyacid dehydrogenase
MKVGFIGVGNMGGPMCRNIIRNTNHDVVVFDLNPAAISACTDLGASAGTSVAQVASTCDVVFTSLPMPRNVEEVALGAGGIADSAKPGMVYIDLSTNSPATARRVNEGMRAKASRCWRLRSPAACRVRPMARSSSWWAAMRWRSTRSFRC